MDDLERVEHKLSIPFAPDIGTPERLERIRIAMVNAIDRIDPASAITLRRYDEIDLIGFIRTVVDADTRQKALRRA
jgi:hypothetical protein